MREAYWFYDAINLPLKLTGIELDGTEVAITKWVFLSSSCERKRLFIDESNQKNKINLTIHFLMLNGA